MDAFQTFVHITYVSFERRWNEHIEEMREKKIIILLNEKWKWDFFQFAMLRMSCMTSFLNVSIDTFALKGILTAYLIRESC